MDQLLTVGDLLIALSGGLVGLVVFIGAIFLYRSATWHRR